MNHVVLGFQEIDGTMGGLVGGKGANLGELAKIHGICLPDGFCVSTEAYRRIVAGNPTIGGLLERLALLTIENGGDIRALSGEIRAAIEAEPIPQDIAAAIAERLALHGENEAYAVRSSATAEDLPTASFAGQQDTYLNVIGKAAILKHVGQCWASLFTERAIIYRLQNGIDHRAVRLAVVIQKMVFPQASGILFTADPITGNRTVSSIDAGFGLGEALVAGLVNPDVYRVRAGRIIDKRIAAKRLLIAARPDGGTRAMAIGPDRQNEPVLDDGRILELERIGRTVEAHFGCPQDIEWCLADGAFQIVQSRPITTLYPIPERHEAKNHVYVSVGHQQMMTDAMKPLGISVFQLTAAAPMFQAGGRLFVDVAEILASPVQRDVMINVLGKSDPLIRDALTTIVERDDLIRPQDSEQQMPGPGEGRRVPSPASGEGRRVPSPAGFRTRIDNDPAIAADLITRSQASIEALKEDIQSKTGTDLFDFILDDIGQFKKFIADPQSMAVILAAMDASAWLNEKMEEWLGEKNAADRLSQSVPNNVTSEMGLALMAVADAIRPYPNVIAYLQQDHGNDFREGLALLDGGREARAAIDAFLDRYGMRCAGEIDITRPRWRERPSVLIPMILANIRNFAPQAGQRKFEQGRQQALEWGQALLERLQQLPDGEQKADEARRMISLMRNFAGYREYPKYAMMNRYFLYKQALLREADRLVQAGVIRERDDIGYLTFAELRDVVRTHELDGAVVAERKDAFRRFEKLAPPRVMTSDGEIVTGSYKRGNLPAGALAGLPVSSGVVEGRARVVMDMAAAALAPGDILVTPFTDPSWTAVFVAIKGLVTEVGGLMTHGAVIAREYGLPAVIGVENATKRIRDGQWIRINGTDGYVELLDEPATEM